MVYVSFFIVIVKQVNGMLMVQYDMGDSEQRIYEVRRRLDDEQYHYVTILRHHNNVTVQVDDLSPRFRSHGTQRTDLSLCGAPGIPILWGLCPL